MFIIQISKFIPSLKWGRSVNTATSVDGSSLSPSSLPALLMRRLNISRHIHHSAGEICDSRAKVFTTMTREPRTRVTDRELPRTGLNCPFASLLQSTFKKHRYYVYGNGVQMRRPKTPLKAKIYDTRTEYTYVAHRKEWGCWRSPAASPHGKGNMTNQELLNKPGSLANNRRIK